MLKGHAAAGSNVNMRKNCIWKTSFPSAILCNIHTSQIAMRAFSIWKYKIRKLKEKVLDMKHPAVLSYYSLMTAVDSK